MSGVWGEPPAKEKRAYFDASEVHFRLCFPPFDAQTNIDALHFCGLWCLFSAAQPTERQGRQAARRRSRVGNGMWDRGKLPALLLEDQGWQSWLGAAKRAPMGATGPPLLPTQHTAANGCHKAIQKAHRALSRHGCHTASAKRATGADQPVSSRPRSRSGGPVQPKKARPSRRERRTERKYPRAAGRPAV